MIYADICAGISAATVAWRPLGWRAAFYSEIDRFPSAVLAHHYPATPNRGDMTRYEEWPDADLDVLIGGTPCQGFSVAGLRKGLDDDRSNLALCFALIARRYQPRWIVWENVPGVRSANGGRDMGAFLRGLAELGYGLCWRSLDAQYAGLAQRRERVFVVGHLGDWRPAAAVLLEPEGLRWDSTPRREKGQGVAHTIASRTRGGGGLGTDFDLDGGLISSTGERAHCLNAGGMGRIDYESETLIAHALRAEGFDASEDGTGRGTPLIPVTYSIMPQNSGKDYKARQVDVSQPLMAGGPVGGNQGGDYILQPVAYGISTQQEPKWAEDLSPTLALPSSSGGGQVTAVAQGWAVRRLTPREAERLQGFPEIHKSVTVLVCEDEKIATASCAALDSQALSRAESAPVAANVLIDLERQAVEIHRAGKLLWSANGAAKPNTSPLSMPLDAFVHLAATMTRIAVPGTPTGGAASPLNMTHSIPRWSGSASVKASGREIEALVRNAARFTDAANLSIMSTTSPSGPRSLSRERTLATLSSCVVAAIALCIPAEMRQGNSYAVIVETVEGFTAIPYRGKPAADGPRYKAIGNSIAVPCLRWIGERIQLCEDVMRSMRVAA